MRFKTPSDMFWRLLTDMNQKLKFMLPKQIPLQC